MRPVNALIATHGLSSIGLGLVFPFTAIYLSDQPGLGNSGVALFYACTGGANLIVALLLTAKIVRLPTVTLGVLGTLLWFAGYASLPWADVHAGAASSAVLIGAGQGCFMAAVIPLINGLVTEDERRAVFARRYAVLNVTLALGSLTAGLLTVGLPRSVIGWFFVANAVAILPMAVAIAVAGRHLPTRAKRPTPRGTPGELGFRKLWALALPPAAFQLSVYLFGFSQFEATSPLVADGLMGMGLFVVSLMLVVNVATIVVAQSPLTKLLKRYPETTGLRIAVLAWIAGFVIAGVCAFGPYEMRLTGLLIYAMIFAIGECAYSCSFHPWLISVVPESELTQASALVNSMMGIGNFLGPSIGVLLVTTGNASTVWFGLAISCAVVTGLVGWFTAARSAATSKVHTAS
ncbi:MFS transporter [Saccharomonospora sp. CUA-673]|uniref:MFS transporter n=1 Tax=Saccharomonospora sp. CUA-673 TaxID=1904969 RepID=UPI0009661B95|nr:MFS transporter [Saccharomonospora sp. CUA-673]OLT48755.1 MFS transporter [Saccharomonospora sp. CUA-673]